MDRVSAANSGIQQSSDFWFADGSVVLEAGHTRFRVHQGILARHSPVFRDMFNLPATPEQPCLDGVPLVDVTDTADDWTYVFTLLYECVSPTDFPLLQALSLVHIARKYQFDKIHVFAMRRLEAAFPRTYERFSEVYNDHLGQAAQWVECDCGETCDVNEVIKVINHAVEWDIPSILPVAYYLVSGLEVKEVLRGTEPCHGPPTLLCRYAQEALLIGQRELENKFYDLVIPWAEHKRPECPFGVPGICNGEPTDCLKEYKRWEEGSFGRPLIPSGDWPRVFMEYPMRYLKLCQRCELDAEEHFHKQRLELWEMLPTIFGLPSWDIIASSSGPNA